MGYSWPPSSPQFNQRSPPPVNLDIVNDMTRSYHDRRRANGGLPLGPSRRRLLTLAAQHAGETAPTARLPAHECLREEGDHSSKLEVTVDDIKRSIFEISTQPTIYEGTWRFRVAQRLRTPVRLAQPATTSNSSFCIRLDFDALSSIDGPVIVRDTQTQANLPYTDVVKMLEAFPTLDRKVFVQDSRASIDGPSCKEYTLEEVIKRFKSDEIDAPPIKLVDLCPATNNHIVPWFIKGRDVSLLCSIRNDALRGQTETGRTKDAKSMKDRSGFATCAKGEAHTDMHRDVNGFDTFLNCAQGEFVFGWVDKPSVESMPEWKANIDQPPESSTYRVILVKPGETVYFPRGTIHFVLRAPSTRCSLTFGGHILRYLQLARWTSIALDILDNPHTTNEDEFGDIYPIMIQIGKYLLALEARVTADGTDKDTKWSQ